MKAFVRLLVLSLLLFTIEGKSQQCSIRLARVGSGDLPRFECEFIDHNQNQGTNSRVALFVVSNSYKPTLHFIEVSENNTERTKYLRIFSPRQFWTINPVTTSDPSSQLIYAIAVELNRPISPEELNKLISTIDREFGDINQLLSALNQFGLRPLAFTENKL